MSNAASCTRDNFISSRRVCGICERRRWTSVRSQQTDKKVFPHFLFHAMLPNGINSLRVSGAWFDHQFIIISWNKWLLVNIKPANKSRKSDSNECWMSIWRLSYLWRRTRHRPYIFTTKMCTFILMHFVRYAAAFSLISPPSLRISTTHNFIN